MKKLLLLSLLTLVAFALYFIYEELSFSPLTKDDFQKLFKEDNINFSKICSKDFLGPSIHGEVFDFYIYKTMGVAVEKNYPIVTEWEHQKVGGTTIIGKWRNCPIDLKTDSLYEASMLKVKNINGAKCSFSFKADMVNPNNYYSYIYFSESESYFLLFCTDRQELCYVRLKGL